MPWQSVISGGARNGRVKNVMTVDLEDWYCDLPFREWEGREDRLQEPTRYMLDLFEERGTRATFFAVGYVAERFPELLREIRDRGHEIGSHTYSHIDLRRVSDAELEKDLDRSTDAIEKITGRRVLGFRAPFFSVSRQRPEQYGIIRKRFAYDSSVFPVRAGLYGMPGAPRFIYRPGPGSFGEGDGEFVEMPPLTLRLAGFNLPAGGGFYFRALPYRLTRRAFSKANGQGRRAVFYIHPKDLDPAMPRVPGYGKHYYWGKKGIRRKFERLLSDFEFVPAAEALPQ